MNSDDLLAIFLDLVCTFGAPSVDCEWCGRTWIGQDDFDPDEYGPFKTTRCISQDDSISHGILEGRILVWECDCKGKERARQVCEYLWTHRELVSLFMRKASQAQFDRASADLARTSEGGAW